MLYLPSQPLTRAKLSSSWAKDVLPIIMHRIIVPITNVHYCALAIHTVTFNFIIIIARFYYNNVY